VLGAILAPLTAAGSFFRHARVLHPEGRVYRGNVVAVAAEPPWFELANRLAGQAIMRFSGAWWQNGREWPELLGCALRLRDVPGCDTLVRSGDQDLLFATARSAWALAGAVLSTNQHDYLQNDYYAIARYSTRHTGAVQLRLVPEAGSRLQGSRLERLEDWVRRGAATLHLEGRPARGREPWVRLADVRVIEAVDIDQAALRFNPFHAGRGLEPRGMLNAMRKAPYQASRWATGS
jgi:hypothetical protein